MNEAILNRRVLESVAATQRLIGRHGPEASAIERSGFVAAVVPALPEASLVNAVVILETELLAGALREMSAVYAEANIQHWGVVLQPTIESANALERAGLRLEARPIAMATIVDDLPLTDPPAEQPTPHRLDLPTIGRINDIAYGHPDNRLERLLQAFPPNVARSYALDHDGEPASVALVIDHGRDANVAFVATLPWAQHQALATRLLAHALREAKARKQHTSTLISSAAGHTLYARLGYRTVGSFELWEKRP